MRGHCAVRSGKPVTVFNVCGNAYRLIVAMHLTANGLHAPV